MQKHIRLDSRVQNLEFAESWSYLTKQEKNYAYWMAKASWAGAKVVYHQVSYEAPGIFLMF